MELIVTSRRAIERGLIIKNRYVVISVRDPGKPKARIIQTTGLQDVIYLAFHDAEPAAGFEIPPSVKIMKRRQAQRIWNFVQSHAANIETIVCHCEQGMSRSLSITHIFLRRGSRA